MDEAAGDLPEGHVAVERAFTGHAEHPLTDDVARHLRRAPADARDLTHQEVIPGAGRRAIAVGPRRADPACDLVRDRSDPRSAHSGEQAAERGGLVGHHTARDALVETLLQRAADDFEHARFTDEARA